MTDGDEYYLRSSRSFHVKAHVLALMLKGASYAALGCAAILLLAFALLGISRALPEASKTAADPTPELSMVAPRPTAPLA